VRQISVMGLWTVYIERTYFGLLWDGAPYHLCIEVVLKS
jgi:hypothetical protein